MIIVDRILEKRERENNPIKIGVVGAGEMSKGLVNQIFKHTPGMIISAVFNRNVSRAEDVVSYAGIEKFVETEEEDVFNDSVSKRIPVITSTVDLLVKNQELDIVIDMTGAIEFSAQLTMSCIEHKKDILSFNAELDATIGPILKHKADEAGVKYSVAEGDQPGVTMNLYRFVKGMGFKPLLCGNIKGMLDNYRNPTTQEGFAKSWGMSPYMATNFADGTKVAFEQACIANATGMGVAKRGMLGYESDKHVDELTHLFDIKDMEARGGIVDFVVGAKPGPGVFIYATTDDPHSKKYLEYGKVGKGPLYSFYVPYHLLFFEIPMSIARMVDFDDTIVASKNGPTVEVVAIAKKELRKGHKLDCIGGYDTYGICENTVDARRDNLLPMALAYRSVLLRDIAKDEVITFDDVDSADHELVFDLWIEQKSMFNL